MLKTASGNIIAIQKLLESLYFIWTVLQHAFPVYHSIFSPQIPNQVSALAS